MKNRTLYDEDLIKFREQLRTYNLQLKEIDGDGNCLFRAIADQLWGDESEHVKLRSDTANYIEENKEMYKFFIEDDENIDDYIAWIRRNGKWAS